MDETKLAIEKLNAAIDQWNKEPLLPKEPIIWANREDASLLKEFFRTGDLNLFFRNA